MKKAAQIVFGVAVAASALLAGFIGATALSVAPSPAVADRDHPAVVPAAFSSPAGPAFYEQTRQVEVPTVTLPNFADIYESVSPSVVSISATKFNDGRNREPDDDNQRFFQDPFQWFFGPGQPDGNNRGRPPRREESGGTGFVITPDGYILTNYHVVEGAEQVRVQLNTDNRDYEGRVVGADPPTDIALVKINPDEDLPYLPLGRSGDLRVGEWVMAIGNPYFYDDTVTVGVVSAKGRRLDGLSRDPSLDDYIQTDAAINVGNSGGPLLNVRGEVIGINTAVSRIGQGIGFAIPIDMAKAILPQLREEGRVSRGAMGIRITDIESMDPDQREYFGLGKVSGALVQEVVPGQPADKANLQPGDAIIEIEGQQLSSSDDLVSRISSFRPGEPVELIYLRDGRRRNTQVVLEDREELWYQGASNVNREVEAPERSMAADAIGIEVEAIDAGARRVFGLEADVDGVVISDVSVRGQGYEKGLRPGIRILEINREAINSLADYNRILADVDEGELVTFYVETPTGARNFVTFRVSEE